MQFTTYIVLWYGVASAITFIAYAIDKRRAVQGHRSRISEGTMHILAFVGGWPGAHAARAVLRHKTRKRVFTLALWMITLLHAVCWMAFFLAR